jgi:hypothetical protein
MLKYIDGRLIDTINWKELKQDPKSDAGCLFIRRGSTPSK